MRDGLFIVFEGIDGCGKSTQVRLLADFYREKGMNVLMTEEPTRNTPVGDLIQRVLEKEITISPKALQLLFTADRAEHLERIIIPALEVGKTVICDRYLFSTLAYGSLASLPMQWLEELNSRFILPDFIFYLRVSPEIAMERIKKRRSGHSIFEQKRKLEKIVRAYNQVAEKFRQEWEDIDGEMPINKVADKIKDILSETEYL